MNLTFDSEKENNTMSDFQALMSPEFIRLLMYNFIEQLNYEENLSDKWGGVMNQE